MEEYVKRIDHKLVHKGKIVEFYEDTMEFTKGNTAKWDYIHHNGAAAVIPVMNDGRLIMVRQYRQAPERTTLEIPAGGVDKGESKATAALRELEEETGYRSEHIYHLFDMYPAPAYSDELIGIYYATNLIPTQQHFDEDECVELEYYTLDELVEMIVAGKIQDSKTVAGILMYKAKLGL